MLMNAVSEATPTGLTAIWLKPNSIALFAKAPAAGAMSGRARCSVRNIAGLSSRNPGITICGASVKLSVEASETTRKSCVWES